MEITPVLLVSLLATFVGILSVISWVLLIAALKYLINEKDGLIKALTEERRHRLAETVKYSDELTRSVASLKSLVDVLELALDNVIPGDSSRVERNDAGDGP